MVQIFKNTQIFKINNSNRTEEIFNFINYKYNFKHAVYAVVFTTNITKDTLNLYKGVKKFFLNNKNNFFLY